MQGKPVAEQEIGKQLLMETVAYAESSVCRRKMLLNYFGEAYEPENCEHCDNCLHPKVKFEGKEFIAMALEVVLAVKEKFKVDHVANILMGNALTSVKSYKHHLLDVFGCGSDKNIRFWNGVLRQMLVLHLIDKDIENYGTLMLTEKGRNFLPIHIQFNFLKIMSMRKVMMMNIRVLLATRTLLLMKNFSLYLKIYAVSLVRN